MPKIDNVGFSECTEIKIDHFTTIIKMHLAITQAVLNKYSLTYPQYYRYIDLTAGKGYSPDGTIKGSPIVFVEQAESDNFQLPYYADFIECETKNLDELKKALNHELESQGWKNPNWQFHLGKYQEIIPSLLPQKSNEFGLLYVDPSGDLPDFNTLQHIAKMRPKMELLIYVSTTNIKRTFQYSQKRLSDYISSIGKKNWLIRKPIPWDQFKWTFLLGSNAPSLFHDYKKIDFFKLETKIGKTILEKLNLTEKEQIESKQLNLNL